MVFGYIHLDYYKNLQTDTYNLQEIGLAKAIANLGHKMIIIFWVSKNDNRCYKTISISSSIIIKFFPYKFHILHHVMPNLNYLDNLGIEVFHIQCDNLFFVPETINYCKERGWKHYCYIGTIHSSSKRSITRRIVNKVSSRNFPALRKTKVFCKTPTVLEELKAKNVTNIDWAPVGLDLSIIPNTNNKDIKDFKKKLSLPADKEIVLFISALRQDKHPMDIFTLAKQLGDNYLIIHVGIEGNLTNEYSMELEKGYANIRFIGTIPNCEIHKYYTTADWLVNFNPNEIFGMAILEAMYHGITVVARHAPGPDCIIENGISGFLCNSIEKMGETIITGKKVEHAKDRVLNNFTWEATAKRFILFAEKGI